MQGFKQLCISKKSKNSSPLCHWKRMSTVTDIQWFWNYHKMVQLAVELSCAHTHKSARRSNFIKITFWLCFSCHNIYRERNQCSDGLSKEAPQQNLVLGWSQNRSVWNTISIIIGLLPITLLMMQHLHDTLYEFLDNYIFLWSFIYWLIGRSYEWMLISNFFLRYTLGHVTYPWYPLLGICFEIVVKCDHYFWICF